jgi:hypothetical protein
MTGETDHKVRPIQLLQLATTATVRGDEKPVWKVKIEETASSLEAFRKRFGDEVLVGIASVDLDGTGSGLSLKMETTLLEDDCSGHALLGISLAGHFQEGTAF